jgi:DNA polymerase III alpha subunit
MIINKELIKTIIPKLHFDFPYTADDYAENLYIENYHCHKDFSNTSTPDCGQTISEYSERIKELKAKCLYSGEHGSQGNQFEVYNLAENIGLKYRHSTEAYWVKDRNKIEYEDYIDNKGIKKTRERKDRTNCHIILVAKNKDGREDINFALSMANIDGYYFKPRIDLELLFNIPKDNVIVTSACIAGWNYEDAEDIWLRVFNHFGDNFFLELQSNNTDKQKSINKRILEMSNKYGIQIIAGMDSHYIADNGRIKREQILKYKGISYPEEDGWYMDYPEAETFINRFREQGVLTDEQIFTAIMNTNIFVNGCEDIVLDRSFKIPTIYGNLTYEEKCQKYKDILNKAYKAEKEKNFEKVKGIQYEANEVIEAGVVDYFLTSKGIVDDAVQNEGGILTTTSRGSAASFVTNKLLGLTTVDRFNADIPIYPERFLTKERVIAGMMPDIDLNCATQEPFVNASRKLLGEHGCYPLMAVEKLKAKAAWQLYAGANDVSPTVANQISKYIDDYEKALKYADEDEKDDIKVEDYIPKEYLDIFKQSNPYRGITINLKCHACGHFIFNGDIRREVGLISAVSQATGKRTLCAAIEGNYLDPFGYVKEDFLIVDSVYLTYKFFKSIGRTVPTFEELRQMIDGDVETWKIYENGITCCVNQCEKESTTKKVMKYKPQSLAELSAFIAGIRPGFASLIHTFIDREKYSTGEEKIDLLLDDTSHFMLYQESIMKVLSFLKLQMSETYGVIKSISKKKLKGEKKEHLLKQLTKAWQDEFGNIDNFNNVWDVIEKSAFYAFNAPHAYSMGGDSAYQAWFKAHYTAKFYEVAINHYQEKENKDKIDALVKEITKYYGYNKGAYEYGADNRKVNIDETNKIIYPNISSVKNFSDKIADTLYECGKMNFSDFKDVYEYLKTNKVNKSRIIDLVKIDYFKKFGKNGTLLEKIKIWDTFDGKKEISKNKVDTLGLNHQLFIKYGRETNKKYVDINTNQIINELICGVGEYSLTEKETLDAQREILGIITHTNPNINKLYGYITSLDDKYSPKIEVYCIKNGKSCEMKIHKTKNYRQPKIKVSYKEIPVNVGDIILLKSVKQEPKRKKVNDEWQSDYTQMEWWINDYSKVTM